MSGVALLAVVIGAVAMTAVARRRGVPAALLVVAAASVVSFLPGLPRLEIDPELILGVVLPPLLYSAALDMSFVSFRRDMWPIAVMGVGLVIFSAFAVGLLAAWLIPGLTLAGALVLGAVLAPSDAVAGVAVGRKLRLPNRLMTIMTGESLVNDAVALVIFQMTVAALVGSRMFIDQPVLLALYSSVVGIGVGLGAALVVHWTRPRLHDPALETVLGAIVPFAAFLAAEQLHASGVLAVVAAGFWLGHHSGDAAFATRLQSRQVWRTVDVVLEAFVFAYMGLQVSWFLRDATAQGVAPLRLLTGVVLVLLAVLLVRPVWVFAVFGPRSRLHMSWRCNVVLSWTGMRGVVTLVAAAGIPATTLTGTPIRDREPIQAIALSVAVLTLLLQGSTLQRLVRSLDISIAEERHRAYTDVVRALHIAQQAARRATNRMAAAAGDAESTALELVERRVEQVLTTGRNLIGEENTDETTDEARRRVTHELIQRILAEQRAALIRERDAGRLDDEVLRAVLQQLDYEEAAACTDLQKRL